MKVAIGIKDSSKRASLMGEDIMCGSMERHMRVSGMMVLRKASVHGDMENMDLLMLVSGSAVSQMVMEYIRLVKMHVLGLNMKVSGEMV